MIGSAAPLADTLWRAVVAAYAVPGVAPLCLRLQAEGDIDVLLLLCLCYAAQVQNAPLSVSEVEALRALSEPWRACAVRPARQLRSDLRDPVLSVPDAVREGFRERVKALELAAERVQADLVAAWLAKRATSGSCDANPGGTASDPLPGLRHFFGTTPVTQSELKLLLAAFAASPGPEAPRT